MRLLVSHTHTPPTRMRRAHAQTHTHTLRIDPPASRRVIHQMVGHTQVCFTVGQCSAAHSRSRQPSLEGREGETERWRREGNSYSNKMRSLEKKKIVLWKVHKTKTGNALLQPGLIHQHHDINRGNPTSNKICWYAPNLLCQIHFGGHVAVQRAHQKEFRVDGVMQDAPCVAHVRQLNHLKWGKDCEFG